MEVRHNIVQIPGSTDQLVYEWTDDGRLLRISGGGRVYVDATEEGRTVFDDGFVISAQSELPGGLLRTMHALGRTWIESFGWDPKGLLTEIDGVHVGYDDQQRIVSCRGAGGDWLYAYSGPYLTVIDTPHGLRQIMRADDGRPLALRNGSRTTEIAYDDDGNRLPRATTSPNWHFDPGGRLWTITDDDGNIVSTYIWDRYHCLGCIGGRVGEPLAMVYSLDFTGTPVRVITRDSIRHFPRDAFGESLLQDQRVPGLFGGAVSDGLVHLPFRRLDPFTGSFDAPDPMDGEKTDPRRASGYTGPLTIELPASGPYTVCRNNPTTLADPTGAISDYAWLIPSALTWSIQNTIGSLLGMWLNLDFSPAGMIIGAAMGGNPFDIGGVSANNYDAFALRSDGWLARVQEDDNGITTRSWTYQFLVNAPSANFTRLEDARLFSPDARFQPRLYGSVLRCKPENNGPFLLRGQRRPPNATSVVDWSRNGGAAEPVIPGSFVPVFPSGAFHFAAVQRDVKHKQTAELVELEPSGSVLTGTISERAMLTVNSTGLGLATDALVLLSTSTGTVVEVARVLSAEEDDGRTRVRVDTAGTALGTIGIRLEGLSPLVGTEPLSPIAGATQRLNLVGSSNDYRASSTVVRLNRGTAAVGADKVTGFEAQLAIDEAVPDTIGNSFRVRSTQATGSILNAKLTANANVLVIDTGTVPDPGTGILIGPTATAIAAIVQSSDTTKKEVTVDRALTPLGGDGTAVDWQAFTPANSLGQRSGPPETSQALITYTPDSPGTAPSTGFVWIEGSVIAARRVASLTYDAIVLSQALPDTDPTAFTVDRFTLQAPDVTATFTSAQVLALNAAPPDDARAFQLVELLGAAPTAGTAITTTTGTVSADTFTVAISDPFRAPGNLDVGDIVILQGTPPEPAAVRRLRLTIPLSRNLSLSADGLEAVVLGPSGPAFAAIRRGDRTFRVVPSVLVSGTATGTDFPRFAIGEIVRVVLGSTFTFIPAPTPNFDLGDTITITLRNSAGNNVNYIFEINDGVAAMINTSNTTAAPTAAAGDIAIQVLSNPAVDSAATTILTLRATMQANGFLVTTNAIENSFDVRPVTTPSVGLPVVTSANATLAVFPSERLYRIQFVNGTTLTGADDEDIIPPDITNLTVTRLDVQDPGTGSTRLGIDGEFDSSTPAQVSFDVWTPRAFRFWDRNYIINNNRVGIIDGQKVVAVRPALAAQSLDVTFLTAPTLTAPLTLTDAKATATPPTAAGAGFSTLFTLDGAAVIFLDTPLTSPGTGMILVVPYTETTRKVKGKLDSGNVRIPNDHENASIELDRRQALEDHELVHTHQSARYGPWLFAYYPLWLTELLLDVSSPVGMPEFGPYVPATLSENSITIPAAAGVTIVEKDKVQVAQSGRAVTIKVGAKNGNVYSLDTKAVQELRKLNIVDGAVQARRAESIDDDIGEWFFNIMQFLTVGGLMNIVAVAGWGWVITLITMFIQWIRGMARKTVVAQLAADRITLTLPPKEPVEGVTAGSLLALRGGGETYVRPVKTVADRTIVLATPAPLKDNDVQISAFSTSSALFPFWHKYFPAEFPDVNRASSLKVLPVGTETLKLEVNDRVHLVSSKGERLNTIVTFVGENGVIEVEEETLVRKGANAEEAKKTEYFVAKIGEDDPVGFGDQLLLDQLHLSWMQYFHDPYGQIVYRAKPTSLAGKIFARSARYLFGTQSWCVVPCMGYFWFDNAFKQGGVTTATGVALDGGGHRSHMEQEASHRSGDTYCPIGTLHGSVEFVGDVARYWLTELGGNRDLESPAGMISLGSQGAPGSQAQQYVAVSPATGSLPAGVFVSDVFSQIDTDLNITGVTDRGWVPVNNLLSRSSGAFVSFTRPGTHVITAMSIPGLASSQDAELNGFKEIISFSRTVADVAVTLSGLPVDDGAVMDLIPFQRALFDVIPNGDRVHRATLQESGAIAKIENDREIVVEGIAPAAAPGGLATENVEISRFYRFDAASGAFDSGLSGIHLPADIDIAVRRLQIRLVTTIPLRATDNPADPAIPALVPGGSGVLLIPAPFSIVDITTSVTGTPSLTPDLTAPATVPANTQAFVRDGGVVNLAIRANDPPEAAATLTITIPVGAGSTKVDVTCEVTINPHFTLDSATGFNLTTGNPLTLTSSDSTKIALVGTLSGIDAVATDDKLVLTRTTAPPGSVVVLVVDTTDNQRMARRTITVA